MQRNILAYCILCVLVTFMEKWTDGQQSNIRHSGAQINASSDSCEAKMVLEKLQAGNIAKKR
jgi:hypothetical protein